MENENNVKKRKKDSARLIWDSKPRRSPNPKDIEFQTAEIVIPNPHRDQSTLSMYMEDLTKYEIDKSKMNRLIWGDNLLAMQALLSQGYEGKIDLIYIDPPFWSGEDYYANFYIGDTEFTKEPSVIERLAYKDIWSGGIDSFLDMLYPRLQLMKRLLSENGSIFVHLDWHIGHYVKIMMDEIFGKDNFLNEIIWSYRRWPAKSKNFQKMHDNIYYYSKNANNKDRVFNVLYEPLAESTLKADGGLKIKNIVDENGKRIRGEKSGEESPGTPQRDVFDISFISATGSERTGFGTQKPEALLEKIIYAASNKNDLVADFFMGSGTTIATADKLGRKWIGCDFSKTAIQMARNRLVDMDIKPFLVENIGNYQRHIIYLYGGRIYEMQKIVLKLYDAIPRADYPDMGIKKSEDDNKELVWVGYPDRPVTSKKVEELALLCDRLDGAGYKKLVILGWDYEYNFDQLWESRKKGLDNLKVTVIPKTIPPEVYDYLKTSKIQEQTKLSGPTIYFHEKPYLKLMKPEIKEIGTKAKVTIGIERYVIFDIPIEKEEDRVKVLEIAKNNFAALIDYWSIDWNYDGITYKSTWQAFRGFGKKIQTVPLKSSYDLENGKEYTIAIRLVDIFGNDATATLKINLR